MTLELPNPGAPPRLVMRGVQKRFGATIALAGVDFEIHAGQVMALVGENGAGKSTLMKVLSGAHAPDVGEMQLDGKPYRPSGPLDARRAGVCMIYQELALAPHMSVEENIMLGMEPTAMGFMKWNQVRQTARQALTELDHGDIRPDIPVGRLSIAAQQLVEIARAVAVGCRVLVLDEPTSSLTQKDVKRLFALIDRLKKKGHAIVYISHFIEEVKTVSDRFTVLRDGASVGGGDAKTATPEQIIAMMVGRNISDLYPRSPRTPGEALLELADVGGVTKPQAASLSLHRGEVLGIAGLVGAGRTEMLRAVFGLDPIKRGTVRLAAYTGRATPARRWDQGMGLVSEDRKNEGLALSMSIADNATLSRLTGLGLMGFISPARQETAAQRWVEKLAVKCRSPRQRIGDLSGGNQQKVAIARLLHHDVDVLLLDEPTRGIDVGSKAQIYALINELAQSGKAVLVVSSYLPELMGICDRIAVMCRGRLGPARPVASVTEESIMIEATGPEAAV